MKPRMLGAVALCAFMVGGFWGAGGGGAAADETPWEIRGELVSLKPGQPEIVLLRVSGARVLEVPLKSFSDAQQAEIIRRSAPPAAVGDSDEAAGLADIEAAAQASRTAIEAADVYRLFLATPGLSDAARQAAEKRLASWSERGLRGDIRLGKEWVEPERAKAARREAEGHVRQAIQMLRLGNGQVAEEELRKASRADLASGTADFVLGIAASSGPRPSSDRAGKFFREVVDREPDHGPALNNLALCEVQARRLSAAAGYFREAAEHLIDPQVIVGNVGNVIRLAADRRNRIAPKHVEEFTTLHRWLMEERGLEPADASSGLVYVSRTGAPLAISGVLDPEAVVGLRGDGPPERSGTGVVVAPLFVIVPTDVVANAGRITVLVDVATGQEELAAIVATRSDLTLLRCEGLVAPAIPLDAVSPPPGAPLLVVYPHPKERVASGPKKVPATVVARPDEEAMLPRLVYSVKGSRQSTGGLLVDASGRLVGLTVRTPALPAIGGDLNVAAPIEAVWSLLRKADVPVTAAAGTTAGDTSRLAETAVKVVVYAPQGQPGDP